MMRNESKTLSDKLIWAFSVGHMPNDLIASIWFNYYAFYLTNIIKIGFFYAGMAIFLGQLADVFGTIIAGRLSDKHKKIHIYIPGVCLVLLSSLSIYFPIRISENPFYLFVYYSFLGILLNLGYSFVMNSHYALISNLTNDIKTRALLIERKVAFSFVSQMLTLIISYYIFSSIITDSQNQYFLLAISTFTLALIFSLIFIYHFIDVEQSKDEILYKVKAKLLGQEIIKTKTEDLANEVELSVVKHQVLGYGGGLVGQNPIMNCLCNKDPIEEINEENTDLSENNINFNNTPRIKILNVDSIEENNNNTDNLRKATNVTMDYKENGGNNNNDENDNENDVYNNLNNTNEPLIDSNNNISTVNNIQSNDEVKTRGHTKNLLTVDDIDQVNNGGFNYRPQTSNKKNEININHEQAKIESQINSYSFIFTKIFIRYLCLYIAIIISYNVTYSSIPYYLLNVLNVQVTPQVQTPIQIIKVYFIISLGSVTNLFLIQNKVKSYKREYMITSGLGLIIFSMLPFMILTETYSDYLLIFFFTFGIGLSTILSTNLEMINDFIGVNNNKSGKIYSVFALGDKLITGIAIFILIYYVVVDKEILTWLFPFFAVFFISVTFALFLFLKEKRLENPSDLLIKEVDENDGDNVFNEDVSKISLLELNR